MRKFKIIGKPLLGEKYVHGKRKKKNNAKFSGHYVYPRTETVRAHALRSHQYISVGVSARDIYRYIDKIFTDTSYDIFTNTC